MFAFVAPFTGLSATTVLVGLVLYSLVILVRNFLVGLQSVPADVREAARGMGYGPARLFWQVELPLALPAFMAGLRVATVSTVALVTVGVIVGHGGLGQLIIGGFNANFYRAADRHRRGRLRAARAARRPAAGRRGAGADPVDPAGERMNLLQEALRYLNDPFNWTRPRGILELLGEHLRISALAVLAAMVLALPVGMLLGHTGRGGGFTVALSNVSRAVPTLALLTIFAVTPIGFGPTATTIALAVFAVPPILTNTYVGFRGVDRDVVEAARAMGMSEWQVIRRVELPLASPLLMTGIRTAAVQVVATATLAALVAGGGLGRIIKLGFGQQDYGAIIAGAILVAALALLTELVLAALSWALTPGPAPAAVPAAASGRPARPTRRPAAPPL